MLIIAIGFGQLGDPFSCSTVAKEDEVEKNDVESVLKFMCDKQKLQRMDIDEILVVENDDVVKAYTYEDGLGDQG